MTDDERIDAIYDAVLVKRSRMAVGELIGARGVPIQAIRARAGVLAACDRELSDQLKELADQWEKR